MKNILPLILVAPLLWGIFELLQELFNLYSIADTQIKLGVLTLGGSAAAFLINNAVQSSRERRAQLFEAKREAYGEFFEFFTSIFHRIDSENPIEQTELLSGFRRLTTKLMTWGSADTINAFNNYIKLSSGPTPSDQKEIFQRTESILRAMRKDLGHSDSALSKLGLSKLLLRGEDHSNLD